MWRIQQAASERRQLQEQNAFLQHRLADILQQRRADDSYREEHPSVEQEKRYLNYLGMTSCQCASERVRYAGVSPFINENENESDWREKFSEMIT